MAKTLTAAAAPRDKACMWRSTHWKQNRIRDCTDRPAAGLQMTRPSTCETAAALRLARLENNGNRFPVRTRDTSTAICRLVDVVLLQQPAEGAAFLADELRRLGDVAVRGRKHAGQIALLELGDHTDLRLAEIEAGGFRLALLPARQRGGSGRRNDDQFPIGEQALPIDQVLQFPNVSRPCVPVHPGRG